MKHSPKRECYCRCLGVRCRNSSRHGQFHFPVIASGPVVIFFGNGTFASCDRRECGRRRETATMATSYQGNVTSLAQSGQDVAAAPVIRTIGFAELGRALRRGWEDFKAVPSHAIILCVIYPVLGLVLARAVLGYSVLPLLFPLAAGFALLGPFAAIGLYELSRRRERGEEVDVSKALHVLRAPAFGAMVELGVLLLVLFGAWIGVANAIYVEIFGHAPAASIPDFARRVLTTPDGWLLIIVGCGVGFLFAVVALCVSVVSFPFMNDTPTT